MNLLIFVVLFGIFDETEQCENFKYTKDVFAPNTIQIIANVTPGSLDYLRGVCTADCYASVQCNAVDFCGTYCRLIRGWDSFYNGSSLGTPCQRYQIVRTRYNLFCNDNWKKVWFASKSTFLRKLIHLTGWQENMHLTSWQENVIGECLYLPFKVVVNQFAFKLYSFFF